MKKEDKLLRRSQYYMTNLLPSFDRPKILILEAIDPRKDKLLNGYHQRTGEIGTVKTIFKESLRVGAIPIRSFFTNL